MIIFTEAAGGGQALADHCSDRHRARVVLPPAPEVPEGPDFSGNARAQAGSSGSCHQSRSHAAGPWTIEVPGPPQHKSTTAQSAQKRSALVLHPSSLSPEPGLASK